jgi:predicted amidohydrolase YtcJ
MKKLLYFTIIAAVFASCQEKTPIDQLIFGGTIYTCDSSFSKIEAVAIQGNEILDIGTEKYLRSKYKAKLELDLQGKVLFPGFVDAHTHMVAYGQDLNELDLSQTHSFDELINAVVAYGQAAPRSLIVGRGWNEENWVAKTRPSNYKLNFLFPDIPVVLQRVDGHAVLANQAAFDLAGITAETKIIGGGVELINGIPTGLLVDKAANILLDKLPEPNSSDRIKGLMAAEKACLAQGLTTVSDAGLDIKIIELIDSLQHAGALKIRMYAMCNPDREKLNAFFNDGPCISEHLMVRSIKLYCDGALGSRGAWLKKPYCDDSTNYGLPQEQMSYYTDWAAYAIEKGLQLNTHCIGDSANAEILKVYANALKGKNDLRWRIEHAQVVDPMDQHYFGDYHIIPSVQPTHATSDMYMAKDRLCSEERLKGAYAYVDLLRNAGTLALGTDFPVEAISPVGTFYAATTRMNAKRDVFRTDQSLDAVSTIKGMTIWAAHANFMDSFIGSIEIGKKADFTLLDNNLIESRTPGECKVVGTMIDGEWLFKRF